MGLQEDTGRQGLQVGREAEDVQAHREGRNNGGRQSSEEAGGAN